MKLNSSPVALPPVVRRAHRSAVAKVPCLCNCGRLTGNRFAPGHDAKLLHFVLNLESGVPVPAPHTKVAAIEVALRKAEGVTGAHCPLLITHDDI